MKRYTALLTINNAIEGTQTIGELKDKLLRLAIDLGELDKKGVVLSSPVEGGCASLLLETGDELLASRLKFDSIRQN